MKAVLMKPLELLLDFLFFPLMPAICRDSNFFFYLHYRFYYFLDDLEFTFRFLIYFGVLLTSSVSIDNILVVFVRSSSASPTSL